MTLGFTRGAALEVPRTFLWLTLFSSWLLVSTIFCSDCYAQNANLQPQIQRHLAAGEFPLATAAAEKLPNAERDAALAAIASQQLQSGAISGAFFTAQQIQLDDNRSSTLGDLYGQQFGDGRPMAGNPPVGNGQAGGITLQDFTPLINLIQSTIKPDSWQDTGQGLGTIQAYPAGVFVSADGTVKRIETDRSQRAIQLKKRAAVDSGNRSVAVDSKLRMVSLSRLERAAEYRAAQGLAPDPMMENLAGLYGIEFLTVLPESGDLVIAGPAGPWQLSPQGRPVNTETGKPVLQLDDLVVCLRNALDGDGRFGCSIEPRQANLVATQEFLANNPMQGNAWSDGLRTALGQQDIKVFGIKPNTHAAGVLVEADYRMKLIGMGLEPTIAECPSYLDRVAEKQETGDADLVRWWFTMNYDDIVADQDRTVFVFAGTGVKVMSENEFLDQQGQRVHTGQSNAETAGFAKDFTDHFDELADVYPVYRQLKNVFDLALVAGLIEQQKLHEQIQWQANYFLAGESPGLHYRVRQDRTPGQVDSVMNEKVVKTREGRTTRKRRIVGVSGGILFDANQVISSPMKTDDSGKLDQRRQQAKPHSSPENWWWD